MNGAHATSGEGTGQRGKILDMKTHLFALAALVGAVSLPAMAQYPPAGSGQANAPAPTVSLAQFLQLQPRQIEALDRLYDGYAARRAEREADIAGLSRQLRAAQSPTHFDARAATRLQRNIGDAQQKVAADGVATRANALELLPPVQRAQLESLANDSRFQVRGDRYFQLFLMPLDAVGGAPLAFASPRFEASNSDRKHLRAKGAGSYGVYGGYGYGQPQIGVYGSYGQGPVGVQAGIGRGGASIGIGIGGIFGGRWR